MATENYKTGNCPKCRSVVRFEPCEMLPKIVPLCDHCEQDQASSWAIGQKRAAWRKLYNRRLPQGYLEAEPGKVQIWFAAALGWTPVKNRGGVGLIGKAGAGKSCTIACLLWTLEQPFLWWSGTEARDAAIYAATADKDRASARQRWEHAMSVPILVLDDISQGKMTESWSASLFDLLETRLGGNLPTLWTSQITLPEIRAKIAKQNGNDTAQADAISRRLAQHSLIIQV